MTLGVGYGGDEMDLASRMSEAEDRRFTNATSSTILPNASLEVTTGFDPSDGVNHSGGSSYSPAMPLGPSSAGLAGLMGMEQEAVQSEAYMKRMAGVSWPTPEIPYTLRPTVSAVRSNINKGWNAAAQPGAAPGLGPMFAEAYFGGSALTYEEAVLWTPEPSPLTQQIGALSAPVAEGQRLDGLNYKEPARELRPGFGAAEERRGGGVVLPMLMMVGFAAWMFTR